MVSGTSLMQHQAHNNRHQKRARWALDSQQVARVIVQSEYEQHSK